MPGPITFSSVPPPRTVGPHKAPWIHLLGGPVGAIASLAVLAFFSISSDLAIAALGMVTLMLVVLALYGRWLRRQINALQRAEGGCAIHRHN